MKNECSMDPISYDYKRSFYHDINRLYRNMSIKTRQKDGIIIVKDKDSKSQLHCLKS